MMPRLMNSAKSSGVAAPRQRTGVARVLSKLGIASRTLAAQWVRDGRVSLNGKVVHDPEMPVAIGRDVLYVDGEPVSAMEKRYVMLNKPSGIVTTARDEQGRTTVYSCFSDRRDQWLAPVGRLDKASEGLLFFTNDTLWANRLLDPASHLVKVYHVQIDRRLNAGQLGQMRGGVRVEDGTMLRVNDVELVRAGEKNCWLEIRLDEGKNRHIRRLLEAFAVKVLRLVRIAIGPVQLGGLAKGRSRALSAAELQAIAAALNSSTRGQ